LPVDSCDTPSTLFTQCRKLLLNFGESGIFLTFRHTLFGKSHLPITRAVRRQELGRWLVAELNERSNVPKGVAQRWVDTEQIIPLLDGLDEVAAGSPIASSFPSGWGIGRRLLTNGEASGSLRECALSESGLASRSAPSVTFSGARESRNLHYRANPRNFGSAATDKQLTNGHRRFESFWLVR